jgi:fumarate hydratase subunit beta
VIIIKTPLDKKQLASLKAGDEVLLTGVIFTARDQAHQRLGAMVKKGLRLPVDLKGQVVYYCGPTKKRPPRAIGSCGPTTSGRMDRLTAPMLRIGISAMIGKGRRSGEVRRLIRKHKAVYFLAIGGAGALLARHVVKSRVVAFRDLGPEAVHKCEVKDFPLIVGIDTKGRDVYDKGDLW